GTTGIIFYYGESPISWSTQKQATVALSSCESEFIAATAAATQALWLKRLLSKLTHSQEEKVTIQVDNKSAIALMKNPVFHGRSKHIDTKYHFIRECVEREDIQVEFVSGEYQKADILTKALPKIKFLTMRQLIGLKDLTSQHFIQYPRDMTKDSEDSSKKEVSTISTTQFQCPMLKPSNYSSWTIRMQIILEANGLWEMIEPLETTQSDNKKDKTAITFLYQALPEEQLLQITKHKTAKAIWDALKTRHIGEQRVQQARLQTLKSDFEMLHMKEDETIDTFTGKLTTLIVASIEQYSDLDEMSVDEAIGRLKTFEERLKSKKEIPVDSQESLMFTRYEDQGKPFRERGRGRFNQSRGREQDKNNYQSKSEERASFKEDTRDKSQVTCYRCHKLGHHAYDCPNKRKNQVREQSNLIEEDLEPTLLMATITEKK
ncbi:zinc finger, CCHC-type containing protein, partial [Tanacetum coccineum]